MRNIALLIVSAAVLCAAPASATPGGLNAEGCHTDRKGGTGYHCHRGSVTARPLAALSTGSQSGAFASCTAARAAGAAPVRQGDPGYGRHLDRDGDGIGCE